MQLYITKEQLKFGPYSVDEVKHYIAEKHFTTSDWAWHEGLTDWVPLHSIPDVVTHNVPPLLPIPSRNDEKAQPLLAKDNKGTRFRDKSHADSHWNARYLTRFTPVVIYNFPSLEAARTAITSLSFIREASDTGELVATEVVEFGCFLRGDRGEVSICGDMFTREMWREAKDKLTAAGGKAYCEKEPKEDTGKTKQSTDVDPSLVKFVREERQAPNTYRMHRGPNKSSAMAFLQAHPVDRRLYYIVVETPEGNLGRDFDGIYNE